MRSKFLLHLSESRHDNFNFVNILDKINAVRVIMI